MFKNRIIILIYSMLIFSADCFGQISADQLVKGLGDKMNQIESFEVDAVIKVDVEFINIKDREVRIKYQAPDQFIFDTKGLALLPKNGMQMEFLSIINGEYVSIEAGNETIGNTITQIVKVIPESLDSDIILAQFWIDPIESRIMRMKTFTRKSGSYMIEFEYESQDDFLPSRLVVAFEISNMSIPIKMMNDFMQNSSTEADSIPKQARVIVEYSNYKITTK